MLSRFFGNHIHTYLHVLGLSGIAFGVPLNKVAMSISMMFIVLNLLLEAQFSNYWSRLKSNKIYLLLLAFFLLHVIAMIWSTNLDYAFHDLRVKLPFLVIPTILAAKPIVNRQHLNIVLGAFIASVLLTSSLNYMSYQHWIGDRVYDDIRGMSIFASHVRFGIIVSMGAAISLYFFGQYKRLRPLLALIVLWFGYYTFYSQVISGATTFTVILLLYAIYSLWGNRRKLAIGVLSTCTLLGVALIAWLFIPVPTKANILEGLPRYTAEGNAYIHYNRVISAETGEPIYLFLCEKELRRDWPKRSSIDFDQGLDLKGQYIKHTLIRYMSSKGLHKDAVGLSKMTDEEIRMVERGIGSAKNYGMLGRLYGIKFQLINDQDPNGNSLLERLEYWGAGSAIFKDNPWIGVGTGDVQDAFDEYYSSSDSRLHAENRHRAHNMYLTVALTFGVFGLALFLFFHFKLLVLNLRKKEVIAVYFIAIALISFLMEDTLETQTGVTFCALFYGMFSTPIPRTEMSGASKS